MGKLNMRVVSPELTLPKRIDVIKARFGLSWRDMARGMGYADKASVIQVRAHPETASRRFIARLDQLEVDLLNQRGLLYELSGRDRLPKKVVICVRRGGQLVEIARATRKVVRG